MSAQAGTGHHIARASGCSVQRQAKVVGICWVSSPEQTGLELEGSFKQWAMVANIHLRKTCWLDCKKLEPEDLGRLCIQEQMSGPLDSLLSPTPRKF